jgi:hypothetical protein
MTLLTTSSSVFGESSVLVMTALIEPLLEVAPRDVSTLVGRYIAKPIARDSKQLQVSELCLGESVGEHTPSMLKTFGLALRAGDQRGGSK